MVTQSVKRNLSVLSALAIVAMVLVAPMAFAAEEAEGGEAASGLGQGLAVMGAALGAGIALAGAAIGTGRAQAAIGAGGTGALAEKPELFTNVLILVALPETVVVFGFVIAFLITQMA